MTRRDTEMNDTTSFIIFYTHNSSQPHTLIIYLTMASSTKAPAAPSLGLKDFYLIAYNALCCIGWAYVLVIGLPTLFKSVSFSTSTGESLVDALKIAGSELYSATPATAGWSDESSPSLAFVLTIVQSAAIMEIVHAVLGLVRSPVFVTMMQVGSRIVALHMVNTSPKAQSKSIYVYLKQGLCINCCQKIH